MCEKITKMLDQAYRVLSDPELRKAHYSWIKNQIKKNATDEKLGIWGGTGPNKYKWPIYYRFTRPLSIRKN
jgi:DnaJ-class molecular chaperone